MVVHEMFRLFAIADGPSIASIAKGLSGEVADHIPASLPHLPKRSRTLAIERRAATWVAAGRLRSTRAGTGSRARIGAWTSSRW